MPTRWLFRIAPAVVLLLLPSACGGDPDVRVVHSGPNTTAKRFVDAWNERDFSALAALSAPPLDRLFEALAAFDSDSRRLVEELRQRYDEDPTHALDKFERQARSFLERWQDLSLEGRISAGEDGEYRYRISYVWEGHRPEADVLTVVNRRGDWKVASFGRHTPDAATIGEMRTTRARFHFTLEPGLRAIRSVEPPTVLEALQLFQKQGAAASGGQR